MPDEEPTPDSAGAKNESWLDLVQDGAKSTMEELPPPVEVVEGIVCEQSKLIIGSGSKSFKTWLTMDMTLSIAHGLSWLGRKTTRRRVLYVNLELKDQTFKRRLQKLAKAKELSVATGWFWHMSLRGKLDGRAVAQIVTEVIAIARQLQVGVVVIDPLYKINFEGEENSTRHQTMLFNSLDRITTEGSCTLVMNDHFGKGNQSDKDPLDAIRGSSAKGGDVDAAMVIRRHETEDCFRVDLVHRELPPAKPFCIEWKFPRMVLRPDLDPEAMKRTRAGRRPSYNPQKLLRAIVGTSAANPISIAAWAKASGVPRQTLSDYLPDFGKKGWIATTGEGNKSRQYITAKGHLLVEQPEPNT